MRFELLCVLMRHKIASLKIDFVEKKTVKIIKSFNFITNLTYSLNKIKKHFF